MKKQTAITLILNLVLATTLIAACNTSSIIPTATLLPKTEIPTESETPIPYSTPVSIISHQEALEQMYGKGVRILPGYEQSDASFTSAEGITYNIRINTFACYWDNLRSEIGFEKCIVVTERSTSYGCHPCGALIDSAVFDRTPTGWKTHSLKSNMIELGSFGQIPKGELVQIGRRKYAALLKGTYAQGGATERLIIIAETEHSFGIIFQIVSYSEYFGGAENSWAYNSKLEFQESENNGEYYDIVVKYFGKAQNGKTPPLQVYKFADQQYVLFYEEK